MGELRFSGERAFNKTNFPINQNPKHFGRGDLPPYNKTILYTALYTAPTMKQKINKQTSKF